MDGDGLSWSKSDLGCSTRRVETETKNTDRLIVATSRARVRQCMPGSIVKHHLSLCLCRPKQLTGYTSAGRDDISTGQSARRWANGLLQAIQLGASRTRLSTA